MPIGATVTASSVGGGNTLGDSPEEGNQILAALADLEVSSFTATGFVIEFEDAGVILTFTGTALANPDPVTGFPRKGAITSMTVYMTDEAAVESTWADLKISALDFWTQLQSAKAGNENASSLLLAALFKNDDIFVADGGDADFVGYRGFDTFYLENSNGGVFADGGDGDDTFFFGAAFRPFSQVVGGSGNDVLHLDGEGTKVYSTTYGPQPPTGLGTNGLMLGDKTLSGVEKIVLEAGSSYGLSLHDANVASRKLLTVDGSAMGAADRLYFDGANETDGRFVVTGGAGGDVFRGGMGNDTFNGQGGDDVFVLFRGGNDTVNGGAGNDLFQFTEAFTRKDKVDGGDGTDTLQLNGDYSAGVRLGANIVGIEILSLQGSPPVGTPPQPGFPVVHSYNFSARDPAVAAGQTLQINAGGLTVADSLIFNGSRELDGKFVFNAGSSHDLIYGGAQNDIFNIGGGTGGDDTVRGYGGDDIFNLGANLTSADSIDGGIGFDQINLNGNYSAGLTLGAVTIVNIEQINLFAGKSYTLTTDSATVASKASLIISAVALSSTDVLKFNGSAETNGAFSIVAGAGDDTLVGGKGADMLTGGAGADSLMGGGGGDSLMCGTGADTLIYTAATDSQITATSNAGMDTIATGFVSGEDHIDLTAFGFTGFARGVRPAMAITGAETNTTRTDFFDVAGFDRAVAIGTEGPNTYVFVDVNKNGDFDAADDMLIKLSGSITLTANDFIF